MYVAKYKTGNLTTVVPPLHSPSVPKLIPPVGLLLVAEASISFSTQVLGLNSYFCRFLTLPSLAPQMINTANQHRKFNGSYSYLINMIMTHRGKI